LVDLIFLPAGIFLTFLYLKLFFMRNAALTLLCFVAIGYAANAQKFSLLPQAGFENSETKISYNGLQSFSPMGIKFSPQASLRLNYSSKQGHGFFVGVASSRSVVSFNFTDPETGMNNFTATTGNMQLRMEGGYQFSSKPISLKCSSSSCCSRSCSRNSGKTKTPSLSRNKSSWVRIQPSIGMGFIPAVRSDVISKTQAGQTTYQYNAGNWNTALIAGAGLEFGRGRTRQLTVSINYIKGIGNLDKQVISSVQAGKAVTTTLKSTTSGWSVKAGIPFTLKAKKPAAKSGAGQHRCCPYRMMYRCNRN
jgi:hypothetical protein